VTIKVNASREYQKLAGFGQASPGTLWHPGPQTLSDSLRARGVEKAYGQVGLNLGRIGTVLESPGSYDQRQNDDNDPFHTNWAGFNTESLDQAKRYVVDLARPLGFSGYFLGGESPNVRWGSPWLASIRNQDYSRFLDEVAEHVLADLTYWKNTYGEELPLYQLGNEQVSGNRALINPDLTGFGSVNPTQQMVDVTARAGARIRGAGFLRTRFIVGAEETELQSLRLSTAILDDSKASQYVGVIGYHAYPYMQGYSSISFILGTSGAGRPDPNRIAVRNDIRDLASRHKVEAWMTENSNAGDSTSYDDFRARAIQIHDEFAYTNAAAYFAMSSMWDLISNRGHFHSDNFLKEEGTTVLINNTTGTVDIAGIGHAIGHYARWIKPGAIRVDAVSSDPLIQATAFHDKALHRVGMVLINNSSDLVTVNVSLSGLALSAGLDGEQSTPAAYWKPLAPIPRQSSSVFQIRLPPISVTSLAGRAD
jgi:O-glycosyl hydrolase